MNARLIVCLLALSVSALSACGGDDDEATGSTTTSTEDATSTTTTAAPTTTAEPTDEDLIEDVAQRFAVLDLDVSGPDDPQIGAVTTGTAREVLEGILRTDDANGHTRQGEVQLETTEISVTGDQAEVRGCLLDGLEVVDADSNVVVEASDAPYLVRLVLTREDGTWKVSEFATHNNEGETTPCALTG